MVKVTGFDVRSAKDGRSFITLQLTSGVEMIKSQATGNYYAIVKKCSIPSTFDETITKQLIGSEIPGNIVKVKCNPYEYKNLRTGEVMILDYNYAYQLEGSEEVTGHTRVSDAFLKSEIPINPIHEHSVQPHPSLYI